VFPVRNKLDVYIPDGGILYMFACLKCYISKPNFGIFIQCQRCASGNDIMTCVVLQAISHLSVHFASLTAKMKLLLPLVLWMWLTTTNVSTTKSFIPSG
jgi:hypothetical protein